MVYMVYLVVVAALFSLGRSNTLSDLFFMKDFMADSCGSGVTDRIAGRFEMSRSLTYEDNMNCEFTLSVTEGKRILLFGKRFELEEIFGDTCLDYLTIHDGPSSNAATLTPDPLCGTIREEFNLTTSSNHVTFKFVSDESAVFRGFAFEYTQFTMAPCVDNLEFPCNNGYCVHVGNVCDDFTQCGDYSDEQGCTREERTAAKSDLPLIIGCTVAGFIVLIIIIIVAVKIYRWYQLRKFIRLNRELTIDDLYQYPVTDLYKKPKIGKKGRREPRVQSYYHTNLMVATSSEDTKYLDEL